MGNGEAAVPEHGVQGSTQTAWQAPSAIERELYEAKARGDWSAYFDVLARTELFVADAYSRLQARPGTVLFTPYWYPQVQANCLPLFTEGMLPAPIRRPSISPTPWGGSPRSGSPTIRRGSWSTPAVRVRRSSRPPRRTARCGAATPSTPPTAKAAHTPP